MFNITETRFVKKHDELTQGVSTNLVPIILLHRNELENILKTIESIEKGTNYPFEIMVVDNASSADILSELEFELKKKSIKLFKNGFNSWILGFNIALSYCEKKYPGFSFYVASDSDIQFPLPSGKVCWLTHLVDLLDKYPFMGKIGLGIDLKNIENRQDLAQTFLNELRFKQKLITPELWHATVDTTAAIYRRDLFVTERARFLPGHYSYIKPYYHVGRTRAPYEVVHIGWDNYSLTDSLNKRFIHEKISCFTIFAGYIDPTQLTLASPYYRYTYLFFRHLFRLIWFGLLLIYWIRYLLQNKFIYQNQLFRRNIS